MIITTSNILLGKTATVTTGEDVSLDPSNITDPDFSSFYISSSNSTLTFSFGATSTINYVAVAGINIEGNKDFSSYVRVSDNGVTIATNFVQRNNCVVVSFDQRSFSNLTVKLFNSSGNLTPSIAFCAAGNAFTVPNNGETSGYNRQFLNRNSKNKSSINQDAAPTSYLIKKVTAKGTLRLPNMTKLFSENEWQDFLDFSSSNNNYFFIREQDIDGDSVNNSSAYLCYEVANNSVTAHPQTRSLNNISISFKVFNGL